MDAGCNQESLEDHDPTTIGVPTTTDINSSTSESSEEEQQANNLVAESDYQAALCGLERFFLTQPNRSTFGRACHDSLVRNLTRIVQPISDEAFQDYVDQYHCLEDDSSDDNANEDQNHDMEEEVPDDLFQHSPLLEIAQSMREYVSEDLLKQPLGEVTRLMVDCKAEGLLDYPLLEIERLKSEYESGDLLDEPRGCASEDMVNQRLQELARELSECESEDLFNQHLQEMERGLRQCGSEDLLYQRLLETARELREYEPEDLLDQPLLKVVQELREGSRQTALRVQNRRDAVLQRALRLSSSNANHSEIDVRPSFIIPQELLASMPTSTSIAAIMEDLNRLADLPEKMQLFQAELEMIEEETKEPPTAQTEHPTDHAESSSAAITPSPTLATKAEDADQDKLQTTPSPTASSEHNADDEDNSNVQSAVGRHQRGKRVNYTDVKDHYESDDYAEDDDAEGDYAEDDDADGDYYAEDDYAEDDDAEDDSVEDDYEYGECGDDYESDYESADERADDCECAAENQEESVAPMTAALAPIDDAGKIQEEEAPKQLRHGKWTPEEDQYVNCLIREFKNGLLLSTDDGVTLCQFLAKSLNCDPRRVSKHHRRQFVEGNLKLKFRRCSTADLNQSTTEQIQQSRAELSHLQLRFEDSVLNVMAAKSPTAATACPQGKGGCHGCHRRFNRHTHGLGVLRSLVCVGLANWSC
jgi:hypothetical protein